MLKKPRNFKIIISFSIVQGKNAIKLPNSRRGLQLIVILLTVIRNDEVGSFIAFLLDGFYAKVSISNYNFLE